MADTNSRYTKELTIEITGGEPVTLKQGEAQAFVRRLDDNPRFFKVANSEDGVVTYYDMDSASCGFCKVATLTPGEQKDGKDILCEDGLPDCEG